MLGKDERGKVCVCVCVNGCFSQWNWVATLLFAAPGKFSAQTTFRVEVGDVGDASRCSPESPLKDTKMNLTTRLSSPLWRLKVEFPSFCPQRVIGQQGLRSQTAPAPPPCLPYYGLSPLPLCLPAVSVAPDSWSPLCCVLVIVWHIFQMWTIRRLLVGGVRCVLPAPGQPGCQLSHTNCPACATLTVRHCTGATPTRPADLNLIWNLVCLFLYFFWCQRCHYISAFLAAVFQWQCFAGDSPKMSTKCCGYNVVVIDYLRFCVTGRHCSAIHHQSH